MMKQFVVCLAFCLSGLAFAAKPVNAGLRVYAIDVQGGQATLFVSPSGESLLVDTGWEGSGGADADRIAATAKEAGLTRIDTVLIVRSDGLQAGTAAQLVARIPVGRFLDPGPSKNPKLPHVKWQHLSLKDDHKLPLGGFQAFGISADPKVLKHPLPEAGRPNRLCGKAPSPPAGKSPAVSASKNASSSIGVVVRFASTNIVDAGNLSSDNATGLVCPNNWIGHADVLLISHHSSVLSQSVLVHSLTPRIVILDSNVALGESGSALDPFVDSPGLQALYQLHEAVAAGSSAAGAVPNTLPEYIANPQGVEGKRIDVTLNPDGSVNVINRRTGMVTHLPPY